MIVVACACVRGVSVCVIDGWCVCACVAADVVVVGVGGVSCCVLIAV